MTQQLARTESSELWSRTSADYIMDSIAPNTARAYAGCLSRWDEWLPTATRTTMDGKVAEYLSRLADQGLSAASVKMMAAALRFRAKMQAERDPLGPESQAVLRGIVRSTTREGRGRGQVTAIRREDLAAAQKIALEDGVRGLRDAAILHTAYDGLLRVSELSALNVEDVECARDGSWGKLHIRRSKTDQESEGKVQFLSEKAYRLIAGWLARAGWPKTGPLFRQVRKNGAVAKGRLSVRTMRQVIVERAEAVGIDGASGHSLRIGMALDLAAAGADLPQIMQAGRWKSERTVARYTASERAGRSAVARLMYGVE